jgi:hypothetical protein
LDDELTNPTLDRLAALEDIRRLKADYCYFADMKKWPEFAALFAVDGTWDLRQFTVGHHPRTGDRLQTTRFPFELLEQIANTVAWPVRGRAAILATARAIADPVATVHKVFAPVIEITSADAATAVWPMEDVLHFPAGSPIMSLHGMGHYHETYARVDNSWLIASVVLQRLWVDAD